MLLSVRNLNKQIGQKELFHELSFTIGENKKIALIGRNGLGKTSLFKLIVGEDKEFTGEIQIKSGVKIILTRQEHFIESDKTALDYILDDVPHYREWQKQLADYEENPSSEMDAIEKYTDTINHFSEAGYYEIEDRIINSLQAFQIKTENILNPLISLSGGEKRFVELVRVMYSGADLALIDEPTNHMDYVGKELFIKWLQDTKKALFIVTHDRDVLKYVNGIYELRDKKMLEFDGNYDNYLQQNNSKTISSISKYETDLKKLSDLKRKITEAAKNKAYKSGKIVYDRFVNEYRELESKLQKPSFWIDKESLENISKRSLDSYEKYKEKNISIRTADKDTDDDSKRELVKINDLSVGYNQPLISDMHIQLHTFDHIFVKGRNGAGKSTLLKTIVSKINGEEPAAKVFDGKFKFNPKLKLGIYEQEINPYFLDKTLYDAVTEVYVEQGLPINEQKVAMLLSSYLFNPSIDSKLTLEKLSGGQKARFQLIKMLSNNPNLLILDEPTNHLDLPSIEQLEQVLNDFKGAILYVTHDNYLIEKVGGRVIEVG